MLAQTRMLRMWAFCTPYLKQTQLKPIRGREKAYLDKKGISYTEQTANTNDEVIAAASSLVADKVDAIFTPTDNVIMAAELAIFKDLAEGIRTIPELTPSSETAHLLPVASTTGSGCTDR